jgi:hypothetical protein
VLARRAEGAFNIAAEPVLDPNALGWVFNTRRLLPLPLPVLRAVVEVSWRLRLPGSEHGPPQRHRRLTLEGEISPARRHNFARR